MGAGESRPRYPAEPADQKAFTAHNDRFYGRFAGVYNRLVRLLPFWRRWIERVIPEIEGPRILELSFGTGHLLSRYAGRYETWGMDYNQRMAQIARQNVAAASQKARLQVADVAALPYRDGSFDTVVCTMAFSAYPDGRAAMAEIARVLAADGRLLLVDVNYPADDNRLGRWAAAFWLAFGDILREMGPLFAEQGLAHGEEAIGGFGSVYFYRAWRERGQGR